MAVEIPARGGFARDGSCCGSTVLMTGPMVDLVSFMQNPPRTTDRYSLTYKWQCRHNQLHSGLVSTTSDDDKWRP